MWNVEDNAVVAISTATLEVNGAVTDLTVGDNLKDVILDAARDAGFGKFKLFVNDEEVLPQNATEFVEADTAYKISKFDTAGSLYSVVTKTTKTTRTFSGQVIFGCFN